METTFTTYKLAWRNHFWWLVPILIWNMIFTPYLPMDRFGGEAPQWLLLTENVCRALVMIFPLFMPVKPASIHFRKGVLLYLCGILIYFASWLYLILFPASPISEQVWILFAPAYTPLIWLAGIALSGRSKFYACISIVFIALHVGEYVYRY